VCLVETWKAYHQKNINLLTKEHWFLKGNKMQSVTMAKAAELAEKRRISREVISFAETKDGKYRAFIKMNGYVTDDEDKMHDCNSRIETSFYYIDSNGLSEQTAIAILLAMATYAFLGTEYQLIGDQCIKELKSGKTKPAKEAVTEDKAEAAEAKKSAAAAKKAEQAEKKAAKAKEAADKKAAAKKPKTIAYDRNQEEHKKQLGSLFNDACPSWGEEEDKTAIAIGLSKELAGKPFLDAKGEVLQDVIEMITDAFTEEVDPSSAL